MNFQFSDIFPYLSAIATGLAGFLAGRRKQNNDFLGELQSSITLLSSENKNLMNEVVELRKENVKLICNQEEMKHQIERLQRENTTLRQEVAQLNEKLSNVKTITKKS